MLNLDRIDKIWTERAELVQTWTEHAKSCQTCIEWLISDINVESDLYALKCVEGWTILTKIGHMHVMLDNPRQFGLI